ncbi:MAG: DUF4258 domain-containing protein [Maribacter sp.]
MAFIKRLGFYLFGLSIGIVFLAMFLKKKSAETGVYFCYLPNCRTLKDIRSKPFYYSEEVSKVMMSRSIDTNQIKELFTNGDIDFGKSNTKSTPCKTYFLEGFISDENVQVLLKNCKEKAILESISFKN